MTAGLDYNLNRPWLADFSDGSTAEIADRLGEDPLTFDPGARFQYSLCHDVLGGVIEAASGMTLRDFMRRNIFEPLGMTRTDFQPNCRPNPPSPRCTISTRPRAASRCARIGTSSPFCRISSPAARG